ncbi:hypothetical protein ACETRX_35055 [Labrys portucalensis]|uniref:Uncharacterized protein n=1 Tax=Labrys neptuniae TaxID=376174 RepID=A0ABV6ZRS3_9HYPH
MASGEVETAELEELAVMAESPQITGFSQDRQGVDRKSGRGLSASRSSSGGRHEAVPQMTSDAVRRPDQDLTILRIRGSYTAVLDKLNFYTDADFLRRRREVASLNLKLSAPELKEASNGRCSNKIRLVLSLRRRRTAKRATAGHVCPREPNSVLELGFRL